MNPAPPAGSAPIRVLAVDDHPLMREGIAALLSGRDDIELVGEATSGREALAQFRLLQPDVTLLDLQMADGSGLDALVAIRRESPTARVVVLTTYAADALARRALAAGAQAYLLKSAVRRDLAELLVGVHRGQSFVSPEVASRLARADAADTLSARELAVLALVAQGHANKVIGHRLSVTEETVKSHVKNILAKLGARDRTHAVRLATERGLLGWEDAM